jgi:topoisomerase-4 subunit A
MHKKSAITLPLVEAENKEENFITEHPGQWIVSTDYRPVAELIFSETRECKKKALLSI